MNVGWGEKSTQFHGSVGKSAAASLIPSVSTSSTSPLASHAKSSPHDDGLPRISWRGDGAFFCVSSLDDLPATATTAADKRRNLRVFNRMAALSSTSEPSIGMEGTLAWQPSGAIIASSQILAVPGEETVEPVQHVIFFEKNGLRRYDFALREDLSLGSDGRRKQSQVKGLAWNSESTILGVWIRRIAVGTSTDVVQLWTRGNYYWYLKQELSSSSLIESIFWHPERALELYLATERGVERFDLGWETYAANRPAPNDDGAVAVVDGGTCPLHLENGH